MKNQDNKDKDIQRLMREEEGVKINQAYTRENLSSTSHLLESTGKGLLGGLLGGNYEVRKQNKKKYINVCNGFIIYQ